MSGTTRGLGTPAVQAASMKAADKAVMVLFIMLPVRVLFVSNPAVQNLPESSHHTLNRFADKPHRHTALPCIKNNLTGYMPPLTEIPPNLLPNPGVSKYRLMLPTA